MKEILLKDYTAPEFLVPSLELYINILDSEVFVETTLECIRNNKRTEKNLPLLLNGKDLELLEVKLNNQKIENYKYEDEVLSINDLPDSFSLYTKVKIDPYNNKSLEGLYKSGSILCTQNEAEGFRRITFFPDRPDVMSKYTITIEGDKTKFPFLLGNGNLVEATNLENNRHSTKWIDPFAKPCYLVAIVAGDLELVEDTYTTCSGREVKLEIYTDHGKGHQAGHAMESLKKSMKWDEEVFGLEYDLDLYMIVAVDSFNAGAMENKGLNIFNSAYVLADPETATDRDFEGVEGVIAHEYFHNWTGNRVTCRDWFQLTLKEGLTVFRDQEFSSDMTDRTVKRIDDVSIVRSYQFPEDRGPNSHPIKPESYMEIDNFYTATVYEKGSEVIRMIHTIIGKENFRKGMDLYFERHDGSAVTTEDFVSAMEDVSNINLEQFKRWYSQAGTPIVDVTSNFSNGEFKLTVKQTLPKTSYNGERKPFYFPLNIGLYSNAGKDLTPADKKQLIITKEEETFTFNIGEEAIPSLLQNFSAPVYLNYNYSTDQLIKLLAHDKDNFNRFDAARRLAMNSIKVIIDDLKNEKAPEIDVRIISAYKNILENSELEKGYLATLLYIPELNNIVTLMDVYDFSLADKARETYIILLAKSLKGTLIRIFEDNVREKYEYTKIAVSERAIKNKALSILSYLNDDIREIALKQFNTGDNMTDYLSAYSSLQKCSNETRLKANKEFFDKWKDNFLVMNKWLMTQSRRNDSNVLDEIKALTNNEIFDKTNPNRIRSLYGAFARGNLAQFHREDGEGYKFIAEAIMDIDGYNSHASSNLASAFQAYEYLSEKQASIMKLQLERIVSKEGISTGLYEIVSKTLNTRK